MKEVLFALVLTINGGDEWILDRDMTARDCVERAQEFPIQAFTAGAAMLTCERQKDSDSVE